MVKKTNQITLVILWVELIKVCVLICLSALPKNYDAPTVSIDQLLTINYNTEAQISFVLYQLQQSFSQTRMLNPDE